VNKRLSALSAFARLMVNKGLLDGNPMELVARAGGKALQAEQIRLSYEHVQKLRSQVCSDMTNVRDRAVVELLYTGLTVRELCRLKYDGSWSADTSAIVSGERQVHLHAKACLALEHYMILRPILRGEYLFAGAGPGWSLKPSRVYCIIRRLARLTGVKIGVSDLRVARYAAEIFGFGPAHVSTPAAA
jgi:site-specific recombinase XerD